MTSLLREEMPLPMTEAASATTTSCPASAAARATASPTTPAPTTSTCIRPAPFALLFVSANAFAAGLVGSLSHRERDGVRG